LPFLSEIDVLFSGILSDSGMTTAGRNKTFVDLIFFFLLERLEI